MNMVHVLQPNMLKVWNISWPLASGRGVLGELKYVSFAATSGLKGQPDMLKYDRARRLLKCVDKVRDSYEKCPA